jgi:hypothetical protein
VSWQGYWCSLYQGAAGFIEWFDHGASGSVFNIAEPNEFIATEKARGELGWHADFRLSP